MGGLHFHLTIKLLLIPYRWDNSDSVWSPFNAANATFDLNSGEWLRLFLLIFCVLYLNNNTENNSLTNGFYCPNERNRFIFLSHCALRLTAS